jgi:hypothetical protein
MNLTSSNLRLLKTMPLSRSGHQPHLRVPEI